MSLLEAARHGKGVKRFIIDSTAHTIFYGVIGGFIALALGIELEIYVAMSIVGTVVQFLSGGLFGKFLDIIRKIAKV